MEGIARSWKFVLSLYLGNRGYRASFVAYGIGFWIFATGAFLTFIDPGGGSPALTFARGLLRNVGLVVLVFMTYPVLRCALRASDATRPRMRFRRVLEPLVVAAFAPIYLVLLVAGFVRYAVGPAVPGIH